MEINRNRLIAKRTLLALFVGVSLAFYLERATAQTNVTLQQVDGAAVQVSADDTNVWVVNEGGRIYRRPVDGSGSWVDLSSRYSAFSDVSASGSGWVWGIQKDGSILKCAKPCQGDGWSLEGGSGSAVRVSADESHVWIVKQDKNTYRRPVDGSGQWEQVGGSLSDVSASGDGWVWGIQPDGSIWQCAKTCAADGSGWLRVDGIAERVSAAESHVWVVARDGKIYRRPVDGSGSWEEAGDSLSSIAVSDAGWMWGTNSASQIYKARLAAAPQPVTPAPPLEPITVSAEALTEVTLGNKARWGDREIWDEVTYFVQTSETTWEQLSKQRLSTVDRWQETGRDATSVYLGKASGETQVINLESRRVYGTAPGGVTTAFIEQVIKASDRQTFTPAPTPPPIRIEGSGSDVSHFEYGDDTKVLFSERRYGAFRQVGEQLWHQEIAQPFRRTLGGNQFTGYVASFTETERTASTVVLSNSEGTVTVSLQDRTVVKRSGGQTEVLGKVLTAGNERVPTAEEIALINAQEQTSNYYQLTSPLTSEGLDQVMRWIGEEVSAKSISFCWKPEPTTVCPTAEQVRLNGQNVKFDCGPGACALNRDECAMAVSDMVFSPVFLALNIASLGLGSAVTAPASAVLGGASAVQQSAIQLSLGPAKWAPLLNALNKAARAAEVIDALNGHYEKMQWMINNVEGFADEIDRWSTDYAANFRELASGRIEGIIDQQFPDPDDRSYIKQKWAQYQLTAMLEADGWRIGKTVASVLSIEPLGIVSTINAFAHPVCRSEDNPFPAVNVLAEVERGLPDPLTRSHIGSAAPVTLPAPQEVSSLNAAISVQQATYGANCGQPAGNVTSHIAAQCNGKSECNYVVDYRVIGDTAPGCAKEYAVTWSCEDGGAVRSVSLAKEAGAGNKTATLSCNPTISVQQATYGANCGQPLGNVTSHIAAQCNGKTECDYVVDYRVIGDTAPGCAKEYAVAWICEDGGSARVVSLGKEAGLGDKTARLTCN